jgi:hypothetical protein
MRNKYHSAVKFFTDSKNEEQLTLSYKEIEHFMGNFERYQWFFTFDPSEMSEAHYNQLSEEYR